MKMNRKVGVVALLGVICATAVTQAAEPMKKAPGVADAAGNLHVPADYREHYEYLGTWAVAADKAPGSQQLHVVYASPGAVAAHRSTGKFPQGTVLIKEVFAADTAAMTTGTVSREKDLKGWFLMVKDGSKSTHPDNPLWGDGWGWSWFDADKPTKTTSSNYKTDCLTCHVPARDTDWIYVQGYPRLAK